MKPTLVSCIMPTWNRREFVPLAIAGFLAQDYPHKELIVIDDGNDPVADLMPAHPSIRYVRRDTRASTGIKRNIACELAQGSLIAHWDDDDWYVQWRLSYQVAAMNRLATDICGLDRVLFYEVNTGQAWEYCWPSGYGHWLAGGTFCYRHSTWMQNKFVDTYDGSDTRFVRAIPEARVASLERTDFYVGRIHARNSSRHDLGRGPWKLVGIDRVYTILGEALAEFRTPMRPAS